MFVKEKIMQKKDSLGRTRIKTIGIFKCDLLSCKRQFEVHRLLKARKQAIMHFCDKECFAVAGQSGNILRKKREAIWQKNLGEKTPFENKNVLKKSKQTLKDKHNVENPFQMSEVQEKIKKTNLKNFGFENPSQSPEIQKKKEETWEQNYGKGITNPSQAEKVKEKKKKTSQKNWGTEYPSQNRKVWQKQHETKKKNGSYGKSKEEDRFYLVLCQFYGKKNIERQIPIFGKIIDFYLKNKNIYIEYDGKYWHGTDKPLKEIKKDADNGGKRSKKNYQKYQEDRKTDKLFQEKNLKLIRITDEEFKKCEKSNNYLKIFEKITEN